MANIQRLPPPEISRQAENHSTAPIPASITEELKSLRSQVAALAVSNKASHRKNFTDKPCSLHGPHSMHTDEECRNKKSSDKQSPSMYAPALSSTLNVSSGNFYIDSGAGRH